MSGALVLLLGLSQGCIESSSKDAMPLSDYSRWQKFDAFPNKYDILAQGYGQAFDIMVTESSWWWVFEVPPGHYEKPRLILTTTTGVYESEYVIFADDSHYQVVLWPPVDVTVAGFARTEVNGEWRIDAFARFPVIPEGDLVQWEVVQ